MNLRKTLFIEIIIVSLIGIAFGFLGSYIEDVHFSKSLQLSHLTPHSSPIIEQKKVVIQENQALTQAVKQAQSDIVPIFLIKNSIPKMVANGFALTRDGLVVALSTSLPKKDLSKLFIGKKTISFQILKRDPEHNLVLIKMEGDGFQTSGFIRDDEINLGGGIFALSSVFASSTSSSSSNSLSYIVNNGLLSQITQDYYFTNMAAGYNLDGSPCFNNKGEFVGLGENLKNGHLIIIPASIIGKFAGL